MRVFRRLVTFACPAVCLGTLTVVAAAPPITYKFSDLAGLRSDGCLAEGALPDVDVRPGGLTASPDGSLYFIDGAMAVRYLRRIRPDAVLTTVARLGTSDHHLAWHPGGWVVASGGDRLRRVNPTGEVLPAGNALNYVGPVAVDGNGTIYTARRSVVLKVTPEGDVVTVAGEEDEVGHADGHGRSARFWSINGVAVDWEGSVYVSDGYFDSGSYTHPARAFGNTIRKIAPNGRVTTFAGSPNTWGWRDGAGAEARLTSPGALAVDASGTLFVADRGNKAIRRVTPNGEVSTVAWGVVAEALAFTADGSLHLVHDNGTTISRLRPDGTLARVAGRGVPSYFEDGPGPLARFGWVSSLAFDAHGRVLVTDEGNRVVRRADQDGRVRTVAGAPDDGPRVARDGVGPDARFFSPYALAVDALGMAFIVDGHSIRRLAPDGVVTTVAGAADEPGFADGPAASARFGYTVGVAVDRWGSLYVADSGNSVIRKVRPDGTVTTLAGAPGQRGHRDGFGDRARFGFMRAMAGDADGTLYVASENTLRRVTRYGDVTTIAGVEGQPGQSDGRGTEARFTRIEAVGLLPHGDILVADVGGLRSVSAEGTVVTLITIADVVGTTCGAAYGGVAALVADGDGSIVISTGDSLRKGVPTAAPAPVVATVTPTRGPDLGHTSLVITGAGFLPATGVAICGVAALSVEVQSSTRIVAVAPPHADATCDVRITNAAGTATAAGAFEYLAPVTVTIRSILPGSPGAGTVAALWGTTVAPAVCRVRDGVALNDQGGPCAFTANVGSQVRLVAAPEVGSVFSWYSPLACSLAGRGPCDLEVDGPVVIWTAFAPAPAVRWFAEGARTDAFRTRFVIANENHSGVQASVRHLADETLVPFAPGMPVFEESLYLPPRSWRELSPHATPRGGFSTVVSATEPLAISRSMTWDRREYGGHADNGVEAPSRTWYFAEGATHDGFQLFYLLANPGDEAAEVEVTWLRPSPLQPMTTAHVVPAGMRTSLWVNQLAGAPRDTDVAAVVRVTNGPAIVAERAMYLDAPGTSFAAGHAGGGVTAPATEWWFAEGATGAYFDTFLLLANPGSEAAEVEAEYARADGTLATRAYRVEPASRLTIWVDQEGAALADAAFSTRLRAQNGVPFVAERAMWWPGPAPSTWAEAHASAGTTRSGTAWVVPGAEADTGRGLETYVLVANTAGEAGRARVDVRFPDGRADGRTYPLPARGRLSIPLSGDFPSANGTMVTVTVRSERQDGDTLGAPPIVVESSTYWDADAGHGRRRWAAGTSAPATRLR